MRNAVAQWILSLGTPKDRAARSLGICWSLSRLDSLLVLAAAVGDLNRECTAHTGFCRMSQGLRY